MAISIDNATFAKRTYVWQDHLWGMAFLPNKWQVQRYIKKSQIWLVWEEFLLE